MIYLQFWTYGSWDPLLSISMGPTANYESRKLFFMTSLQFHCILGLAEIKTLHPRDKIMSKRCRMRRKKITASYNNFPDILMTSFYCQNLQRAITKKTTFLNFHQVIYSLSSISWPSLKLLAVVVFEISGLQVFNARNLLRAITQKIK